MLLHFRCNANRLLRGNLARQWSQGSSLKTCMGLN
jgi:hypothetical protein